MVFMWLVASTKMIRRVRTSGPTSTMTTKTGLPRPSPGQMAPRPPYRIRTRPSHQGRQVMLRARRVKARSRHSLLPRSHRPLLHNPKLADCPLAKAWSSKREPPKSQLWWPNHLPLSNLPSLLGPPYLPSRGHHRLLLNLLPPTSEDLVENPGSRRARLRLDLHLGRLPPTTSAARRGETVLLMGTGSSIIPNLGATNRSLTAGVR